MIVCTVCLTLLLPSTTGLVSVWGFLYVTPALDAIGIHDTNGVHNLHGLPAIIGSMAGAIDAGILPRHVSLDSRGKSRQLP